MTCTLSCFKSVSFNIRSRRKKMNFQQSETDFYENATTLLIKKSKTFVPVYILVVTAISCCLSLVGALFIFHSYYAITSIRNYIRKLLVFLTISNVIDVLGIILGVVRSIILDYTNVTFSTEKQICVFQSFVTSFAPCSSFFWTVIIAVYFQVQVLRPSWADKLIYKCSFVLYHILSWGVPALICLIALFMGVFGDTKEIFTGPWCWIKTNQRKKSTAIIWMLVTVKGWELLSYLLLGEVIVFVLYKMYILPRLVANRRDPDETAQRRRTYSLLFEESVNAPNKLRKGDRKFVLVWLIFYLLRLGGTCRFVMHVIHDPLKESTLKYLDKVMMIWQAVGDTAQAFVNFLVLCVWDSTIRKHYVCRSASGLNNNHVTQDNADASESNLELSVSLQD